MWQRGGAGWVNDPQRRLSGKLAQVTIGFDLEAVFAEEQVGNGARIGTADGP